jgi:4-hydroxybenzoate polyprenyltransferase
MKDGDIPLCVDLDGTLTPVDTLHENLLGLVRHSPQSVVALPAWLAKGKAAFKRQVAAHAPLDAALLPFRHELLEWLREQRAAGRKLVLATAADRGVADAIANHLALFDEVVASDGEHNLSGEGKRQALVARFGEKGFDYAGNDKPDRIVWKSSRQAIVVGDAAAVEEARKVASVAKVFSVQRPSLRLWLKAARLHQWVKNLLIFVPALLAHVILQPPIVFNTVLAFLAFGLCASSVYLINDLLDLEADRRHPRKRNRPFATGQLSAGSGALAAALLLAAAIALAVAVNGYFCAVLAGYYVFTWAYSLRLKQIALLDVMMLAGLYTLRIIAGAAATRIPPSFWLLAFSVFIFLSLGIVKRFTELEDARQAGKNNASRRGYSADDLSLLMSLGTSSGYCAIVVMALYINSSDAQLLYTHHKPLWLMCPLMLFWISRIWLLTARAQMHDDPIVFALRDRVSLLLLALLAAIIFISI